jgi:potassium-transporting ATPase potassium-binding subunit
MLNDSYGWVQLGIFVLILLALTKPMGVYLTRVLDPKGKTFLDPVLKPVEKLIYRVAGIREENEQSWRVYTVSLLIFSLAGFLLTYAILRLQQYLPLNPQKFEALSPYLSFNTAASFTTNTNWQSYAGESSLSYFSQMVGLTLHNFTSAAVGIAVAAALARGISRSSSATLGNFWTDIIRIHLYILIPICLVYAVFLVSQGTIDNFRHYDVVNLLDGGTAKTQTIAQGPVASQEAIKMLGTNGGGFFNANSAHPFENPTPFTNLLQVLSIFLIPAGLAWYLGQAVGNKRHGWTLWAVMLGLFLALLLVSWGAESSGNPRLNALGLDPATGNMEGKEVRFGIAGSTLFSTVTTDASCGAVNSMHDSFTPLGGLVPMLNIQLGEIIFGGVGSGLYGMLVFVIITVFLAGLMIGRTPEYLGKKIDSYDVKVSVLFIMVPVFMILGMTAWSCVSKWGLAGLNNSGPHGLSEMLYAFSSATGNNGSAFAGLNANTQWYNSTIGVAMLFGRFFMIVPVLALAGNLAAKKRIHDSAGAFPVSGIMFAFLLAGVILIVGALTFFPVLSLGPIVEHFLMMKSGILF